MSIVFYEIKCKIDGLQQKRMILNREIDAEIAKLRVLCEHKRTQSYPAKGSQPCTTCLDCGKWW